MNKKALSSGIAFLVVASQGGAASASASDWSFNISPYLWIAGIQIETTLDRTPPTTPSSSVDRFDTSFGGGALLAGQIHYKSIGLWADFVWVQTDTHSLQPGPAFSAVDLETDFYHSTIAFSYILPTTGKFHVELLAGARFWSVSVELTAHERWLPGFVVSQDETWVTPVIGVDLRYDLNAKWGLLAKGTVGVANEDSEGWEIMGGVAYRFGDHWSATLGYRYLHEEYSRQRFTYFTDVSGAILGVSFRF
ncbi:MAG: hypothetical protein QM760_21460 [Nibricoccus sp.]